MATHSSILAWEIPRTEEPGGLQSMGPQRFGHDQVMKERRQQQLRRLQELNARRREEKLQLDQERLDRLLYVQVMQTPEWAPALFFL